MPLSQTQTILCYTTKRGTISRGLDFGLDHAYRMLSEVIAETDMGNAGTWYCERWVH